MLSQHKNIKKFIKRAFGILLAAAICLISMSACKTTKESYFYEFDDDEVNSVAVDNQVNTNGSEKKSKNGNKTTNKTTNKAGGSLSEIMNNIPAELKGTTITVYSWNPANDCTGAVKVIEDFTKKTGIKVKWNVGNYASYATEISALVAAGKSPDIIRHKLFDPAILKNSEPLSKTGFDFKSSEWDKTVTDYYTVNGEIYAANLKNTLIQQPTVLFYNRDTIAKYGFEDPYQLWKKGKWNWNKFYEMLDEFHKETGKPSWSPVTYMDIANAQNEGYTKKVGDRYQSNMKSKVLYNGLVEMTNMIQDGLVDLVPINYGGIVVEDNLFLSRSMIDARRVSFQFTNFKKQNKLGVVPIPQKGSTYYQHYGELEAYGLAKGAKNPKAAYYFLRYYLDSNNYDKNTFFNDQTILDVYEWCRKQDKIYTMDEDTVITNATGDIYRVMYLQVSQTKPDQVYTTIDKHSGQVADAVKWANNIFDKMK